jgi:hypothetical protein
VKGLKIIQGENKTYTVVKGFKTIQGENKSNTAVKGLRQYKEKLKIIPQ